MTTIACVPLTPDRLADFLAFFDGDAFSDNPRWSSCYCQCFYEDHAVVRWGERTAAQNRHCATERIGAQSMQGVLAYRAGRVVGWCNAAPRRLLHALDDEAVDGVERVGTILCFVVAPQARGRGIARALLSAACDQLRDQGLTKVEANPRPAARSAAEQHFGPIALYLSAGFEPDPQRVDADGSVWVSKRL